MLISIIIITLNEIENLEKTITTVRLAAQNNLDHSIPIELIVSDGGSKDGTLELAQKIADIILHLLLHSS